MIQKFSPIQMAIGVSVLLHAAILLVRVANPEAFNRVLETTPLEVILVNAKSNEDPAKAQAVAQTSLSGGGELDKGRATSPLPPSAMTEIGDSMEDSHKHLEALEQQQNRLLTQVQQELNALPPPSEAKENDGSLEAQAQEEKRRQLLRQLAEIEKRIQEQNARPTRRYISPNVKEEAYALYVDKLKKRIEDRGTRNFPQAKGQKLYGELTMVISVNSVGNVVRRLFPKASLVISSTSEVQLQDQEEYL